MRWTPQSVSRPASSRSPRNPVSRPRAGQNSTPAAIWTTPRAMPTSADRRRRRGSLASGQRATARPRPTSEVARAQAIVPAVRERGGQREADRGDGRDVGDEARGDRCPGSSTSTSLRPLDSVYAPHARAGTGRSARGARSRGTRRSAAGSRRPRVDTNVKINGTDINASPSSRRGTLAAFRLHPISESTPWGKWCATRARCEIAALAVARGFHFRTAFQCGTGALAPARSRMNSLCRAGTGGSTGYGWAPNEFARFGCGTPSALIP